VQQPQKDDLLVSFVTGTRAQKDDRRVSFSAQKYTRRDSGVPCAYA